MENCRIFNIISFVLLIVSVQAQNKSMSPEVYDKWNSIEGVQLSSNGEWVVYSVKPGKGDNVLHLYNTTTAKNYTFDRASKAQFDYDNNFLAFRITAPYDTIQNLKRKKVKKDKFPKDTLGVFIFRDLYLDKVSNVKSFKMPKKSGSVLAYQKEKRSMKKDSTLVKKEGGNGTQLFVINFMKDTSYKFDYVKDYSWSERNHKLLVHSTGLDSFQNNTLSIHDGSTMTTKLLLEQKGKYSRFALSQDGNQVSFIADRDTSKSHPRPIELMYWKNGNAKANSIGDKNSKFLPANYQISNYKTPLFSENGTRLYFGIQPSTPEIDSTLTEDDKVELEIWNYKDGLLHTQQNVRLKREKERSYDVVVDLKKYKFATLGSHLLPETAINEKHNGKYILSYSNLPYQQSITWEGYAPNDVYLTDIETGKQKMIASAIHGRPEMSPAEKYIFWYSRKDTSWITYNIETSRKQAISKAEFYDEINDRPMHPRQSGDLGWTNNDESILLYDRYDIWKLDPDNGKRRTNLTNGRGDKIRYRHVRIDKEVSSYPHDTTLLLKMFDEKDKTSGYAHLNLADKTVKNIERGKFNYTTRIVKAKNSDKYIFSKGNFETYPDLILTDANFKNQSQITKANPHRTDYEWGTIELVEWTHPDGKPTEGLLVKPPGFDPAKKYPMIVNFYERSSHRLYDNRDPYPHRSTINYSYWANKGYVIFNPDVRYQNGYPGKSCEDAVFSGVDYILKMGFVDEDRIGLQGHSWGGYQIAHLLTKTDRFKCAEAGAPVVNMVSAYGGIRWGSGMSRMFQYERTQSRLGATLWERPDLYLENSPIFNTDKVNTPVLILHNDNDGAVPWYQGIEYFVALRRLSKPAWLLNYNGEPHWPLKRQNRIDFNKRLEQFFDHYLMDKAMPEWMSKGVPAVEKEYNDGFELMKNED